MNEFANVAQLAEQPPCERQVAGSNPGHWLQLSRGGVESRHAIRSEHEAANASAVVRDHEPLRFMADTSEGNRISRSSARPARNPSTIALGCSHRPARRPVHQKDGLPVQSGACASGGLVHTVQGRRSAHLFPKPAVLVFSPNQHIASSLQCGGPGAARGCCRVHALSPFT